MRRAVGIVDAPLWAEHTVSRSARPTTVRVGNVKYGITNDYLRRWSTGEPVLVQYDPQDQFVTIIDPNTLEPL